MERLGVKDQLRPCDILKCLTEFQNRVDSDFLADRDISLLKQLLLVLSETIKPGHDDEDLSSVMLPDTTGKLYHIDKLCFDDCPWIQCDEKVQIVHEKISKEIARMLGVRTKQDWFAGENSEEMPFGQKEELTTRLKGLLNGYPCDETILKELVQNADDSGATEICFIKDLRNHEDEQVFSEMWKKLQGPALCVFINKSFTEKDIEGIQSLGKGNKQNDPLKTGQYGVGFNCVYHLTDVPSFITTPSSGETLCVFDPNQQYVDSKTCGKRYKLPQTKFPHVFSCYPNELREQNGTLFRFPLRTIEMAKTSKLKEKPFQVTDLEWLLESFKTGAKESLLFTKNIKAIKIMNTLPDGSFEKIYEIQAGVECASVAQHQCFVEHLSDIAAGLQSGFKLEDVEAREVEYFVNLKDERGTEKWFVRKRVGFEESGSIPEKIKEAYNSGQIGCLPTGGIAFPLSLKKISCKAYMCMPLDFETGLPAAVDGHFILNHENRRNLYSSTHGDLDTVWNSTLVKLLLAPMYGSCLVVLKQTLLSQLDLNKALVKFHSLFPLHSKTDGYWKQLCVSVYQWLDKTSASVLPVLEEGTKKEMFVKKWLPPTSELTDEAYVDILGDQCDTQRGLQSTKTEKMSSVIRKILVKLDFNLVATPLDIMNSFVSADVQVKAVDPDIVLSFLKQVPSNSSGLKLNNLPTCIKNTPIQTTENLLTLIRYCHKSEKIKELEGLPFQLNCANQLNVFSASGIFYSKHYKVLPASAEEFLDNAVGKCLELKDDHLPYPFVIPFLISHFASLLPLEGSQLVCRTAQPVEWNISENQNKQWIISIWKFIGDKIKKLQKQDEACQVKHCLQELESWSLIPVIRTCYQKPQYYLAPVSYADQILLPNNSSVCRALTTMGMFVFTTLSPFQYSKLQPIFQELLVTPTDPGAVLVAVNKMLEDQQVPNFGPTAEYRDVLSFFDNEIKIVQSMKKSKELRALPFFLTRFGHLVSLSSQSGIVLPERVPAHGLNEWSRSLDLVLLKEDSCLSRLYHFLGLDRKTDLDFYCEYTLQFFHHLDAMSRKRHLEYIRRELVHNAKGSDQLPRLLRVLQQLAFIPHQGCLQKASDFFDHQNVLLKSILEDDKFVPDSFREECWYDLLKECGLVMKIHGDLYLQLAYQLEKEAKNATGNKILSKSQNLVSYLFTCLGEDNGLLERIRDVKFLVSVPFATSLEQFVPFAVPEARMMPFNGSALPGDASLLWTIRGILPEYCINKMCQVNTVQQNNTDVCTTLGIIMMPTSKEVIDNMLNVSRKLMEENSLQSDKFNKLAELISVLSRMYDFLQEQKLSSSELETLKQAEGILIPTHRCFVRPSLVVVELDTNKEIPPYLFRLPSKFGPYASLFRMVGTRQKECAEHYVSVLCAIKKFAGGNPLHPNEIEACLKSLKGLYQILKNSDSGKNISELYLPVRKGEGDQTIVLVPSTDVVISDQTYLEDRLRSFQLPFLIDLRKINIASRDFFEQIPQDHKPQLLSRIVKKELTAECEDSKQRTAECDRFENILSNADLISAFIRLFRHHSLDNDCFDERHAAEITSRMRNVAIFVVPKITTHLVFNSNVIQGSQSDSYDIHTQSQKDKGEFVRHIVICQDLLTKGESYICAEIGNELHNLLSEIPNVEKVLGYTAMLLMRACSNEPIHPYLDEKGISSDRTDVDVKLTPTFPPPGEYLPLSMHCLLDASFSSFEPNEYAGYEVWDPLLTGEGGRPVYTYVIILEEALTESGPEEMNWQKKYRVKLNCSGEIAIIKAIDLYKLARKPQITSTAVECYVGSIKLTDDSLKDEKTLQQIKNDVFKMLEAAWTNQDNRKKVLKRLLLMWHPDKNADHEAFCTQVTQYILKLVERFEEGNFVPPTDADVNSQPGHSWQPSSGTWFSEFYDSTMTRSTHYRFDFEGFRSDTSDGRTPQSNRGGYSSGHSKNPQPSEGHRWIRQAQADYQNIGNDQQSSTWACFKAQQVAEKAMKAVIYCRDASSNILRGHDLSYIASLLDDKKISDSACRLEDVIGRQGYLRTRYPDMVHGSSIPEEVFTQEQAALAQRRAKDILDQCAELVTSS